MSRPPAHTITLQPWGSISFGQHIALEISSAALWPLKPDERMTVTINLLADQIADIAENEDQVDAILDVLRMKMRMMKLARQDSPPIQSSGSDR